jgi:hypothetical protein
LIFVRFEVFTAVTMKNGVFWDLGRVALVRTDVSEELSASFIRVTRFGELVTTLAVTSVVPSSPFLVALMKEALSSSETPVVTRATRRNNPEDAILHCHRRENLRSYKWVTLFIRNREITSSNVGCPD